MSHTIVLEFRFCSETFDSLCINRIPAFWAKVWVRRCGYNSKIYDNSVGLLNFLPLFLWHATLLTRHVNYKWFLGWPAGLESVEWYCEGVGQILVNSCHRFRPNITGRNWQRVILIDFLKTWKSRTLYFSLCASSLYSPFLLLMILRCNFIISRPSGTAHPCRSACTRLSYAMIMAICVRL